MHFESRARRRWIFFLRACSFIDSGKRDSRADREQLSQHSAVRPMSIIDTVIAYRSRALYLLGGYLRRCLSLLWKRKSPDNTFSELICTTLAMARPLLLHSLNKKRTRRVYKPRQFTVFFSLWKTLCPLQVVFQISQLSQINSILSHFVLAKQLLLQYRGGEISWKQSRTNSSIRLWSHFMTGKKSCSRKNNYLCRLSGTILQDINI